MKQLILMRDGIAATRSALEAHGAVLLGDVADDGLLLKLAGDFGEVIQPGVGMQKGAHDGRIYSVESQRGGTGHRDQYGNLILSTTASEFPLHTDGYNRAEPPRHVLLMRADRSNDQTESFTCDASAAVGDLPEDAVEILKRPLFPSAKGPVALLDRSNGIERLRFNRHEIDNWSKHGFGMLEEPAVRAITALEGELSRRKESFLIEPGQCLLLDNWRSCHGRSALTVGSKRVLRRVWVL
jgi:alpha-ketoglutarate-dependent taurine dioxygenase